jgi:hypothetical protein
VDKLSLCRDGSADGKRVRSFALNLDTNADRADRVTALLRVFCPDGLTLNAVTRQRRRSLNWHLTWLTTLPLIFTGTVWDSPMAPLGHGIYSCADLELRIPHIAARDCRRPRD